MIACENGHLNIVRVLVDKRANVGHRNKVYIIIKGIAPYAAMSYYMCWFIRKGTHV